MKMKITLLTIAFIILTTSSFAAVRINGIGMDYATIQAAVTNSLDGDVLIVTTGLYNEAVNIFGRNISIDGKYSFDYSTKAASGSTIIDPPILAGSCIDITGAVVELIELELTGSSFIISGSGGGLNIKNGSIVTARLCNIHNNSVPSNGGGVYVNNSSLTLIDSPVYSNSAEYGGGIYGNAGQISLNSNSFVSANSATRIGGGIRLTGNSICDVNHTDADIKNNFAPEGGGVAANNSSDIFIRNGADIFGNIAVTRGGGILLENGSSAAIHGIKTSVGWYSGAERRNSVTNGNGGGVYAADSTITVSNYARFVNNYANGNGGGIYLTNSSALIDNAIIGYANISSTNYAEGAGGGICMLDSSLIVTNGGVIQRGNAGGGGGVLAVNSTLGFYDGSILGNINPAFGNSASAGGALYIMGSTVRCDNVQIVGNRAISGGGAAFLFTNDVTIVKSSIFENLSSTAGGILAASTIGRFILDNTEVVSNISVGDAGGIYWSSLATLDALNGSRICDNVASGAVGAVYMNLPGTLAFQDTEISGNEADTAVGGIASIAGGEVSLRDCMINNNNGDADGDTNGVCGGIYVVGGSLNIIASNSNFTVMSNSSPYAGGIYASATRVSIEAFPGRTCQIDGNSATIIGGGILFSYGTTATISGNVSIDMNKASIGGGIYATNACAVSLYPSAGASPKLQNNISETLGGGLYGLSDSAFFLTNVLVAGNNAQIGGGAYMGEQSELTAINCTIEDNTAILFGGGIYASFGSRLLVDSDFSIVPPADLPPSVIRDNSALSQGGGIVCNGVDDARIANALVVSNTAPTLSGGIGVIFSTCRVVNVIVAHNDGGATHGDGLFFGNNNLIEIQNCTIANNYSNGVYQVSGPSPAILQNCIVWGHLGYQVSTNATAVFCDIQNGFPGAFNITNNPAFINPDANNFQVMGFSETINKGMTIISITNDCIGEPRPYDGAWDMGAYEFIPEPALFIIYYLLFIIYYQRKYNLKK